MLTLDAPYRGETEAATLGAIRSGATPSACARRAELPAEVDSVLGALLAPSASARPASAEDARRALEQLRDRSAPDHHPSEIAALVHSLLGPEAGPPIASIARVEALNEPTVPLVAAPPAEPFVLRASVPPSPPLPAMPTTPAAGSRTRAALVLLGTAVAAVLATAFFLRDPEPAPARPRPAARERVTTASVGDARPTKAVERPAALVNPPATPGPGERPSPTPGPTGRTKRANGATGPHVVAVSNPPVAPPVANEPAVVTLNSWPWSIASVDGRTLPGHTPLRGVELSPGSHTFRFENPELHMRRVVTITLAPGERRVVSAVLEPDAGGAGGAGATP